MALPPGISYLWSLLPFLLLPPVLTYEILRFIKSNTNLNVPTWLTVLAVALSRPLLSTFRRSYKRYSNKRAAGALNAFPVPHVVLKSLDINGFGLMKTFVKDAQTNYPGELLGQWAKEYGPVFQLRLPSDDRIVTTEPDHIKAGAVLSTQFDAFSKGPLMFKQLYSMLGAGVFNSDGDLWRFHRSMARPYFSRERISHFDNFEEHATSALSQAEKRLQEGYAIDFQDLAARFTLDSATQFLIGYDVQSLSAGIPYPESASHLNTPEYLHHPSNTFANAFGEGQRAVLARLRLGPIWPLAECRSDAVLPFRKVVESYIEPLVQAAVKRKDAEKAIVDNTERGPGETLLDDLIQQTQDIGILKDQLINLLAAGRDSTTSTLTYAFYMIAEHPEIEARLRREIFDIVGPVERPSYDQIRNLKLLRAFISEVLRLYPAVPANSRISTKPVVWASKTGSKPYYVPAGTTLRYFAPVLFSTFALHRRTDLWGPDALQFDPDRFLDDRLEKYLTPNPHIFVPFGTGPRICLGQEFAYQEISFFLIRLLQRFSNLRLAPDAQPEDSKPPAHWAHGKGPQATAKIRPALGLNMSVRGGLWVRMDAL